MIAEGETYKSILEKMETEPFYLNGERKKSVEILIKSYAVRLRDAIEKEFHPHTSCQTKKLTLDEAIAHAEECANDTPCGQNHRQLADWLRELRELRKSVRRLDDAIWTDPEGNVNIDMGEDAIHKILQTALEGRRDG